MSDSDHDFLYPVTRRQLSPTDISRYSRLDNCERFLRLRMYEREHGGRFLYEFGVQPQAAMPLSAKMGLSFEKQVEAGIRQSYPLRHFGEAPLRDEESSVRREDNDRLIEALRAMAPGDTLLIAQCRLASSIGEWLIRGDADLLRIECNPDGTVDVLVTDIKSATAVQVDHRLQVAFYHALLSRLLAEAAIPVRVISTAILYRGPADADSPEMEAQRQEAHRLFGITGAHLLIIPEKDAETYLYEVQDFVGKPDSHASRIANSRFEDLFFSLNFKCDGCLYSEFCLKDAHQRADLALIPCLPPRDKKALLSAGVRNIADLASLKEFADEESNDLVPADGAEPILRRLASTSAGPRIDELVLRARKSPVLTARLRQGAPRPPRGSEIPNKGYTTLPFSSETHNPNLVTVYLDATQDYIEGRICLIGALVVANEKGKPTRSRHIVRMTDGPPDTAAKEAELFAEWIRGTLEAIVTLAASDANGERKAPIHLIFWNDFGQRLLLEGLARNITPMVRSAPALYDFITQLAAYDSPVATFLDEEVRERKNYPMLCQSLISVSQYLRFPWDEPKYGVTDFRKRFRERLFDVQGKMTDADGVAEFYTRRSRHSSQTPLEYIYAAWNRLPEPDPKERDLFAPFRGVTAKDLTALQMRRLDALRHITDQFHGNPLTEKTAFHLPDLSRFSDCATHLAQALAEFCAIERHVFLAAWKAGRNLPPERRVLLGETLLVRYHEADQLPGVAERNRENARREELFQRMKADFHAANPSGKFRRSKAQMEQTKCDMEAMSLRLRVDLTGVDTDLDTLLGLLDFKEGSRLVLYPRWTEDERLPEAERVRQTPTPKQMLHGARVTFRRMVVERDESKRAVAAVVEVEVCGSRGNSPPYAFSAIARPLKPDELYTLDPDPNDYMGLYQSKVCEALVALEEQGIPENHPFYCRLSRGLRETGDSRDADVWPDIARVGQARFFGGLKAYHAAGLLHDFEAGKQRYIAEEGGTPVLLVQGPPGTGKSYSTAFAVLARLQGALVAGLPLRVLLCCKTHSATDVLMKGVAEAIRKLASLRDENRAIWSADFDDSLLSVPLWRVAQGENLPESVKIVPPDSTLSKRFEEMQYVIAGATPGSIYKLVKEKWEKRNENLCGHALCELLVLDEASQMSLPEAMMASLPLAPEGRVVIVGDPRQMPPIVQNTWENESRRTFQQYRAYESLFNFVLEKNAPLIQFEESFRLHAVIAKFLRDEVYIHDGIEYRSNRDWTLPHRSESDPFVAAALAPDFPLVVVLHDESGSQKSNLFEQELISPILEALASPDRYGLDARTGLGVVVPHRAQRAGLLTAMPMLRELDETTGQLKLSAVDTVEKYQGDEREVILVSVTESDPEYIAASAGFLLDPRRLTVALSRAKRKMVLVASRSIFTYFTGDEEMFRCSQIWKNLLRRTCIVPLWEGERHGHRVTVWGSGPGSG